MPQEDRSLVSVGRQLMLLQSEAPSAEDEEMRPCPTETAKERPRLVASDTKADKGVSTVANICDQVSSAVPSRPGDREISRRCERGQSSKDGCKPRRKALHLKEHQSKGDHYAPSR